MNTSAAPAALAALLAETGIRRLFQALDGRGEEIRIVGGAVRNVLLGLPVTDIDCATTALPEEIMRRAAVAGLRTVPTGLPHGTVTVLVEGRPVEVTTLREDLETDGRRATVRFGRSFEHDAARRDFALNALYLDGAGRLHDYAGGLADLAARRVRFIGDAHTRIREDYLRIFRFFRFHAQYGHGAMDRQGIAACITEQAGIAILSRERIRAELLKTLVAPGALAAIEAMADSGILGAALGGVAFPGRLAALISTEAREGGRADAGLRLAALAVETSEDAERLRDRLRLSNDEHTLANLAADLVRLTRRLTREPSGTFVRELIYRYGEAARRLLAGMAAAAGSAAWQGCLADLASWTAPANPFAGSVLLEHGVAAGPAMGRLLKQLECDWIAAGFPTSPDRIGQLLAQRLHP
jgi:poly(A) polymerase